jgi:hypothetical protein
MGGGSPRTISASELADYAYCPRSHWYALHPPSGGPSDDGRRRSAAGERSHARALGSTQRRANHGAAYWVAFALGLLLAAGGSLWLLR